jgi:hypothetical protein
MTMARRPSMQSARIYLLGYLLWTLGVGSVMHPLLYDARNGHGCSYGLTGWPAAMWVAGAMGLIVFPVLMAITRVTAGRATDLTHSALALRIGAAHLVLVPVGVVIAVLVGNGSLNEHDPLDLAPFILTPILFVVLNIGRPMRRMLPGAMVVTILPLVIVGWRLELNDEGLNLLYSAWIRDGSMVLYFIWAAILLAGLATGVIAHVMKSGNAVAAQVSLVGISMLLVSVPAVLTLAGFLVAHSVYCAD